MGDFQGQTVHLPEGTSRNGYMLGKEGCNVNDAMFIHVWNRIMVIHGHLL